jgi:1,4-alpha-glucan branching enzyme
LEFCQNGWKMKKTMAKKINSKSVGIGRKQTFTITAPGALSVQLMGDFTHWQEHPISMKNDDKGVWRTTVELAPGTHHYRFFVDGKWHDDPECTLRAPNPYGGENMIRQISASGTAQTASSGRSQNPG